MSNLNENQSISRNMVKEGVWTPTAAVLCLACHGPNFKRKVYEGLEWEIIKAPVAMEPGNNITYCDHCGDPIQINASICGEHNLMRDLRKEGIDANMWQTGGMCSAVGITKRIYKPEDVVDEIIPHFLITYDVDGDNQYVLIDETNQTVFSTESATKIFQYVLAEKDSLEKIKLLNYKI